MDQHFAGRARTMAVICRGGAMKAEGRDCCLRRLYAIAMNGRRGGWEVEKLKAQV